MSRPDVLQLPAVRACSNLVDRAGANSFTIGYLRRDPADPGWYARADYKGTALACEGHPTADDAATALARRLLRGAACMCGKKVATVGADPARCRWTLIDDRWTAACNTAPLAPGDAVRGDLASMRQAWQERQDANAAAARRAGGRRGGRRRR